MNPYAKKARPSAATPGRAQGLDTASQAAANPKGKHNTKNRREQDGFIAALLPKGEGNAIPTAQLMELTGIQYVRELRHEVAKERAAGYLILSTRRNGGGYFLPDDGEAGQREILAHISTMQAQAVNMLRSVKAARNALGPILGQEAFEEWEL